MAFVLENLRLADLVAIVKQNQRFYDEFVAFLKKQGYADIHAFIKEEDDAKARRVLSEYLLHQSVAQLHDGLGRPYSDAKAKWYFLAWIMRDAPAQRLEPLLRSLEGASLEQRKTNLLNHLRKFVGPLFPEAANWSWPALSEVMLARLEGSRRALKGTKFENTVREALRGIFATHKIPLKVGGGERRINEETYDVQIHTDHQTLLMPVKTRETMGGGHANLFTRDIFKSISVARAHGYECIPVIIAESWSGDLNTLGCKNIIYIQANPNQGELIETQLVAELTKLLPVWKQLAKE